MLKRTIEKLAAGSVIAAAGLLSVCGVANAAPAAGGPVPAQDMIAASSPANGVPSVDCGSIDTPNGAGRFEVIADSTRAGRVGCTEAFTVTDAYLRLAPTRSQGTAHVLNVDGWTCLTDTGAYGTGRIRCEKDGLAFHADPLV